MVWLSKFGAKSPLVSHNVLAIVTQPLFAGNYKDLWFYSSSARDKRALIWLWNLLLVPTDTSSQETPSTPTGKWSSSVTKSVGVYLTMKKRYRHIDTTTNNNHFDNAKYNIQAAGTFLNTIIHRTVKFLYPLFFIVYDYSSIPELQRRFTPTTWVGNYIPLLYMSVIPYPVLNPDWSKCCK